MSGDIGIGRLIEGEAHRDAIHVAVAPMVASERMYPGDWVSLKEDGTAMRGGDYPIGIVDPFLTNFVHAGVRFWLFLRPGSITSLRHEWTHPAFAEVERSANQSSSELWLMDFASMRDLDYSEMIEAVRSGGVFGNDISCDREIPDDFWLHWERAIGPMPQKDRPHYFSCAC